MFFRFLTLNRVGILNESKSSFIFLIWVVIIGIMLFWFYKIASMRQDDLIVFCVTSIIAILTIGVTYFFTKNR